MRMSWRVETLRTREPFIIARGGSSEFPRVFVELEHDGRLGRGEAAPSAYYHEDSSSVERALATVARELGNDPWLLDSELSRAARLAPRDASARAALDMALHDLVAQNLGVPLYRLLGLARSPLPPTSFTIGIGTVEEMESRARQARDYPILKIKLGWDGDICFLRRLRRSTSQILRVDANEGWTPQAAIEHVAELHETVGVELVEQPCPASDLDGLARVTEVSPVPILADESCIRLGDIPRLVGAVHGINIKLAKCGGIREAWHMIRLARELGLRVMIGCMVESSLGITAAAHLGSAVDYLDLDGNLLLDEDPFRGVLCEAGRLTLPEAPGLGVEPMAKKHSSSGG